MSITLKNAANADVVFFLTGVNGNTAIFDSASDSLLGRKRIEVTLKSSSAVNRVGYKLTLPSVCDDATACGVSKMKYTQIASGDISVVKASTALDRNDLAALQASLAANASIQNMIKNGVMPS